jgi:hypothetical protein
MKENGKDKEMTETQRRAYGIGKDAATTGEDLDANLDWACSEGILPDSYEVDLFARMGYASVKMATA